MIRKQFLAISFTVGFLGITAIFTPLTFATELEQIKSRGQLIVAVKDNLRPLGFINSQGQLVGLEIDIARRLAKEILGNPEAVRLKAVSNQDRLKVLLENQVDLVIARVSDTPSRRRIVDFSPYYYLDGTGLVTNNFSINSLENLNQGKIAVLSNSATIAVLKHTLPNAQLIGVNSYQEALQILENNRADAFSADVSLLTGWIQEYPQYKLLPARLSGEALCIAMPKGLQYQELREAVSAAIATWQQSGWLQERLIHWGFTEIDR